MQTFIGSGWPQTKKSTENKTDRAVNIMYQFRTADGQGVFSKKRSNFFLLFFQYSVNLLFLSAWQKISWRNTEHFILFYFISSFLIQSAMNIFFVELWCLCSKNRDHTNAVCFQCKRRFLVFADACPVSLWLFVKYKVSARRKGKRFKRLN